MTHEKISKSFKFGSHGSTFGGNPLSCAVALAVVSEVKQVKFLKQIKENSEYFLKNLNELKKKYNKIILDVRGIGFIIGLEIDNIETRDLIIKLLKEKYDVLAIGSGDKVLRILPPLISSKANIDWFTLKLEEALII